MWENKYTISLDERKVWRRIAPFNLTRDDEVQGSVDPSGEAGVSQSNGYHDGERSGPLDITWKHKVARVSMQNYRLYIESSLRSWIVDFLKLISI